MEDQIIWISDVQAEDLSMILQELDGNQLD